ncbi:MAG: MFS transporter [Bacillota bacterium]
MDKPGQDPKDLEKIVYEQPDEERPASPNPTQATLEYESPAGREARVHDPYAALRFRDYQLYSIGWILATAGQQMQATALQWEIFDRTGSYQMLGWLGGVQAIPLLALALPAGYLADMFDRRFVATITSILAAICSIALAFLSYRTGSIGPMFAILVLSSTALVVGRPARSSMLPQLVPLSVFSNAVTWNSSFFQVATMLGPALAGWIIHYHSTRMVYVVDAGCGIAFAVLVLLLRPVHHDTNGIDRSFVAGVRFVWRTKIILATITLDLFAVLLGGAVYLLPVFAKDILHVGSVGFGWLRAADAIGAFSMAMLIAHLPPMKKAGRAMLLAVIGFGAATVVFGLSRNYWLSLVMLVLIGAFDNISVVVRHTLVQVLTPDAMRGRVSAVNNIFIGASNELGGMESGLTAAWFGPITSVVGGGVGTILVVLAIALLFPQVRRFGSLADAKPEE